MAAAVEFLSGVVRFWANDSAQYGDPYEWCATVRWINPDTVEILGVIKPPSKQVWAAVLSELGQYGAKELVFYRIKNGVKREHRLRVPSVGFLEVNGMSGEVSVNSELAVTTPGNLREVVIEMKADWDDNPNSLPGYENRVVYRDLPPAGFAKLQQEIAGVFQRMADFGAAAIGG
jgi:hypothetical protein